ncbi:glycosyltransferase [Methylobacterium frigidaeris]|uniref:D-inositol-3-phosphate glycosyltransferase n=2 Tax=Methylobacterium frigidaeris TaxID=2038277 RepID=A0AA37HEZ9_9HYPH|nr:glycosyltransferase [Methylobacterium frigidaeris]GJD64812.1 D-inositol-3-phosphate glycosyltransferase [Methylobacterium frigidaeris]
MNLFKLPRLGSRKKGEGLDVKFYRNYYADMSGASDREVFKHWEEFGRAEGRFANEALARDSAISSGKLPKDFDVETYLKLNPDVAAAIKWDFQAVLHYVEHGRAEGRPYADAASGAARGGSALPRGFNLASYVACNPDVARIITSNAGRLNHYSEHGRAEKRNYKPLFFDADFISQLYGVTIPRDASVEEAVATVKQKLRPSEDQLVYFNEEEIAKTSNINIPYFSKYFDHNFYYYKYLKGSGKFLNRAECIRHFCEIGQYEQFDISPDGVFDDDFFRAEYGADGPGSGSSRRERYALWLRSGADEPRWPNLRVLAHLRHGAKLPRAVESFVAATVGREADQAEPVTPSRVMRDLLEWKRDLDDPEVAGFFIDAADALATQGRSVEAAELYARALRHAPTHPRGLNHRADLIHRGGNLALATDLRRDVVALGCSNEWTFLHLAQGLLELGEPKAAMRAMAAGVEKYPGDVGLRRRLRELQEKFFYDVWEKSADVALLSGYDEARALVTEAARSLMRDEERPPGAGRVRRVALYANCDLPQCRFYRVEQRAEQLAAAGYEVAVYDYTKDHDKYMSDLTKIDYTIFYRVPAFPNVIDAITKTSELGIVTIYDIDDLVFDPEYFPPALDTYAGLIDARQHASMACGVSLFAEAAAACDYGMASTPSLARHLERRVRTGTVFHQPNALSSAHLVSMQGQASAHGDIVTVFYGSGTKAHKLDFEQLIEPALARLFETHGDRVRVVVVGEITVSERLRPWAKHIIASRPIANVASYWDLLHEADINLSVLVSDTFNDCKSEIKWMEAAMFGIPSVVSSTQTHREVIVEGETGFLCETSEAFYAALDRLVRSRDDRRRIGEAAKRAVLETYGLERQAGRLSEIIERTTARQLAPRRKLVIVNVFYPPQAIGGATRVVYDNVRSLRAILGPEWQIDVICTLEGGPTPYALDWYIRDGVRVYCITAANHPAIDNVVEDPEMGRVFDRVLDRIEPDLIHFHCIQRLTTSCVTAAIRRRIPYLITMHDGWWISPHQFLIDGNRAVETYDFSGKASLDAFMGEGYARARTLLRCIRGATRVLTVSHPFGALCRSVGLSEIEVVENGVSRLPKVIRTASPTGRVRLGFIGGLADHKGYGLIRNVLFNEPFKNISLLLIDHAMHPNERVTEEWGSVPVEIRGKFPQSSVGGLYAHIDVLLAPSVWPESYGLVTREAIASGCWVVASNRGAVADCVVEGRNGYIVDVADEAGLLAALRFIDDNPAIHLRSPDDNAPIRTANQQAEELAVIYGEVIDADRAKRA